MDKPAASLYDRLGRRDGITRITRTLIDLHLANPAVKARFAPADRQTLELHAIEFFCAGSGGPEAYTGKDMVTAHRGMNVNEQEFVAVVDDAMAALQQHGVDAATQNDVLGILWSLKGQVVRL